MITVKDQFCLKYDAVRRQFMPRAEDGAERPEQTRFVNEKLQGYLSVATPPRDKVIAYLVEIARVHAPAWTPAPELADPPNPDLIDLSYTGHFVAGGGGAAAMGPPPSVMAAHTAAGDVSVTFTDAALGMDLAGLDHSGREAANPDTPTACVIVTGVRPGTQAEASKQVMRGQAIKAVNHTPVIGGFSFNQTLQAIQAAGRPVSIVLGPPPPMAALGASPQMAQAPPGYAPRGEPQPGYGAPPPGFAVPALVTAVVADDPVAMFPAVPVSVPVVAAAPVAAAAPADFDDLEARFQALKTAGR